MSQKETVLGTQKITQLFIHYAIPNIIALIISGSQVMIDGMFVGNYAGTNGLAGINMAQPFMNIITGASMVLSVGALSLIGRKLGENKKEEAQNIFRTAVITLALIAVILGIVGSIGQNKIASLLGASEVLLPLSASYIGILSLFSPIICLMYLFAFIDRLIQRPDLYLKGMIASIIVNVVLDYIFVKNLGLGVKGAAFATGIAYSVAFFIVIPPLLSKKHTLNLWKGRFTPSTIKGMMYNGSSEAIIAISIAVTGLIFNNTFLRLLGETGVAAFTVINYIGQLGISIMFGISDGITPIVSYNYGAKNEKRVKEILHLAQKVTCIIGLTLFLILFIGGKSLIELFIDEGGKEAVTLAVRGSKFYAFTFLICGLNIVHSGFLTAIGDAKGSIIISLLRGMIGVVIGIMILPLILGVDGIWLTLPSVELVTWLSTQHLITRIFKR